MRLRVTINTQDKCIPYEYHGFLQGVIYHALSKEYGDFFHDQGFENENRIYKMFVFSDLVGDYHTTREGLLFDNIACFYISSISSEFMNQLYIFFKQTDEITLGNHSFQIKEVIPIEDMMIHEDHTYLIQTLSPIISCKTDTHRYTTYFHPKSSDFEENIRSNIKRKYKTLFENNENQFFEILDVRNIKERKVKYKRCIFLGYHCTMKIIISDEYLKLMMHTGMGSKNSGGFGMIRIIG